MTDSILIAIDELRAVLDGYRTEVCDTREASRILGISRARVNEIPESELRPVWVGPSRGRKGYRRIDLIRYIEGLPPLDHPEIIERMMPGEPVTDRPRVIRLDGKKQVL